MHELSIASSIIETVLKEVEKREINSVVSISLRIGALTAIVPDALQFGFEAITKGTLLEMTELRMEIIPLKGTCNVCRKEFEVLDFVFVCPHCASVDIETTQGNELEITSIEVDE